VFVCQGVRLTVQDLSHDDMNPRTTLKCEKFDDRKGRSFLNCSKINVRLKSCRQTHETQLHDGIKEDTSQVPVASIDAN
jgi:hypothetical protein